VEGKLVWGYGYLRGLSGVQGQSSGKGQEAKPPEAEHFFTNYKKF